MEEYRFGIRQRWKISTLSTDEMTVLQIGSVYLSVSPSGNEAKVAIRFSK